MVTNPMNAISLFSGVGGFELACQRAGLDVVASVEIDKAARGVLAHRFPGTPLYEDVARVHAYRPDAPCEDCLPDGRVDVVCGGFPCQDLSVAGRRAGLAGLRSGLFYELARVISETAPRWVVLENVPGLLSSNDGRDMAAVVGTLGDLGYGWAYRVLDAQFFGVPQRRRRVFIVGHFGDRAAPVEILLEPEGGSGDRPAGRATGQRFAASLTAGASASRGVSRPRRRQEDDVNLVVNALTSAQGGPDDNDAQAGHLVPIPLAVRGRDGGAQLEAGLPGDPYNALRAGDGGSSRQSLIAFAWQAGGNNDASGAFNDDGTTPTLPKSQTLAIAPSLTAGMGTNAGHPGDAGKDQLALAVAAAAQTVRRLTPTECERLQGFPDGWTEGQADSARYRQMGNAVAVPVVEWIMRRLAEAS